MAVSFAAGASVLPPLPVPLKSGTGVIDGNTIYVGLGSAGKAWYKLDTTAPDRKWEPVAAFPGATREQSTSVIINGNIYVFGGVGKNESGLTQAFNDVYTYNTSGNIWHKLMSHSPQGMVGHVTWVHGGKVFTVGGVNQNIFNGYFSDVSLASGNKSLLNDINKNYFDKAADDYLYGRTILTFDPDSSQWHYYGTVPFQGTAGATPVVNGNSIILINGEVKPGLRTDEVIAGKFKNKELVWKKLSPVSSPDGVAGGFGGMSQGNVIFAGGAYFPGARENYNRGEFYAHQGLKKTYSDKVYLYRKGAWSEAGKLPEGVAYGVSLPWKNGLLMIGGETSGGQAIADSVWLGVSNSHLEIKK
ncbi:YjhT family mutarotase [Salmonella enterica subsp. diarizonae]|nr:YjhT family mutarotase [Salmonella enterica subsp. diarizonae]